MAGQTFDYLKIVLNEKGKDDWRGGVVIPGEDSDFEYRSSGSTWQRALQQLVEYIEKESWDCELPKNPSRCGLSFEEWAKLYPPAKASCEPPLSCRACQEPTDSYESAEKSREYVDEEHYGFAVTTVVEWQGKFYVVWDGNTLSCGFRDYVPGEKSS